MDKTNMKKPNKKFVVNYLFVNGVEQLEFKVKIDGTEKNRLCLGNISAEWSSTSYSTQTGFYGHVYDFAVDYVPISGKKQYMTFTDTG